MRVENRKWERGRSFGKSEMILCDVGGGYYWYKTPERERGERERNPKNRRKGKGVGEMNESYNGASQW